MPHPHLDIFTLSAQAVLPILDDLPPTRTALVANMEPALNAEWDAAPAAVDNIAVVGAGVVGSLVAWPFGRLPGICVTLIDIEPSRADLALALAVEFAAPSVAPNDCDLVVHASGTVAGLASTLGLAAKEATVLELSWYGAGELAIPLGGAFRSRRLWLVSSQVGRGVHRTKRDERRAAGASPRSICSRTLDWAHFSPARSNFTFCRRGCQIFSRGRAACFANS
jgi:threonine dehydrogenase-like Zn-dependent dehydrogenase